ncbi:hypothetical protein Q8A67_007917 [Cirrhinus molitorella]|uniref:Uncharacterized protein n=1 Tax=Cirrhinus molitorella TaxID=172907 RepID=A0AA88TR90_9TELE|nr:hypothetical protein Q8A67_007917 [Cirrhinus molitorella]
MFSALVAPAVRFLASRGDPSKAPDRQHLTLKLLAVSSPHFSLSLGCRVSLAAAARGRPHGRGKEGNGAGGGLGHWLSHAPSPRAGAGVTAARGVVMETAIATVRDDITSASYENLRVRVIAPVNVSNKCFSS